MHCASLLRPPRRSQARTRFTLAALIISSSWLLSSCEGCGVTVHNEVAYRASQLLAIPSVSPSWSHSAAPWADRAFSDNLGQNVLSTSSADKEEASSPISRPLDRFRDTILERKGSLLAGSFFPDWGYDCIGKLWNNAAEEAHWPPFIEAAINHIVETYPQPWKNDHAKDLIVFLFGAVSHEAADVLWHSLEGLHGGFVSLLAMTSFEGDYSKAHTLADVGAEFVLSHMANMGHLATTWKIPVRDLTMIYRRLNHFVPGTVLSHCMRNGYAASQANSRLGGKLFPVYASKSPFLVEQIEDYPLGGLRDMTAWTIGCWQGLATHLTERFGSAPVRHDEPFKLCDVFLDPVNKTTPHKRRRSQGNRSPPHHHHSGSSGTSAIAQLLEHGYTIHTSDDDATGTVSFSIERSPDTSHHDRDEQDHSKATDDPPATFSTSSTSETTCAALSEDEDFVTQVLYLPLPYSSFGHAVTMGDFDGDGEPEMAISAPHATFDSHVPSQGAVYIVRGSKVSEHYQEREKQQQQQQHHIRSHREKIAPLSPLDVRTIASAVLTGNASEPQGRFGWSLATVDLNGDGIDDLAIGAPGEGNQYGLSYSGAIYVFFGRKDIGLQEARLENVDLVIRHQPANEEAEEPAPSPSTEQQHQKQQQRQRQRRRPIDSLVGLGTRLNGIDLTGDGFKDLVAQSPLASALAPVAPPPPPSSSRNKDFFFSDEQPDPGQALIPQAGKVSVFLASSRHQGLVVADTARDWELAGQVSHGWFGASLAVFQQEQHDRHNDQETPKEAAKASRTVMVVGSPMMGLAGQKETKVMVGHIQGFVLPTATAITPGTTAASDDPAPPLPLQPTRIFSLQGDRKFQQFGSRLEALYVPQSSSSLGNGNDDSNDSTDPAPPSLQPVLVAGSQSEEIKVPLPRIGKLWQAGVVRVLNLSSIPDGTETTISQLEDPPRRRRRYPCRSSRNSRQGGGRGAQGDGDDDDGDDGEDKYKSIVLATLKGSQSLAHLSAAMAVSSSGTKSTSSSPSSSPSSLIQGGIWLTEPLAKAEAGRILKWEPKLGQGGDSGEGRGGGDGDDDGGEPIPLPPDGVSQCYLGSEFRGRFGAAIVVEDVNMDGTEDLIVTSAHSSTFAT
ncbi:Glycosylphosphatidylinositol specific phospholipase D1 [Actinomortierella ambigua]|nr:Glycosylphosphatidylinositol specific phospholipase D1 [Actinomortierella ambigua]